MYSFKPSCDPLLHPVLLYTIPYYCTLSRTSVHYPIRFYTIVHSFTLLCTHLRYYVLFYFILYCFTLSRTPECKNLRKLLNSLRYPVSWNPGLPELGVHLLNPILAGVLENQDTLGGGQFDPPPPLNPILMSKYDKWYIIGNSKFAKFDFFCCKIQLYCKIVGNKNCPKNDKIYICEKLLTMLFQICKKFCKIFYNLMCN